MTGTGEGLTVLDPRFPIRWTLTAPIFDGLADGWDDRTTTRRAIARGARRDTLTEASYVRAVTEETAPMTIVPAGPVYQELAPAVLEATAPVLGGVAAVYAEPEPARRRWWGRRAAA